MQRIEARLNARLGDENATRLRSQDVPVLDLGDAQGGDARRVVGEEGPIPDLRQVVMWGR